MILLLTTPTTEGIEPFTSRGAGQVRDRLNGLFQIVLFQVVGYIRNNCSLAQIFRFSLCNFRKWNTFRKKTKTVVKKLLDAFLTKKHLQSLAR